MTLVKRKAVKFGKGRHRPMKEEANCHDTPVIAIKRTDKLPLDHKLNV